VSTLFLFPKTTNPLDIYILPLTQDNVTEIKRTYIRAPREIRTRCLQCPFCRT